MTYVACKDGVIVGCYANRQLGYAEEELEDDHPDILAPKPPDPRVVADEEER